MDPRAITQLIRRRWRPIALSMVLVLALAAFMYTQAEREYVAVGSVALDRRVEQLVQTSGTQNPVTTDSSSVETEVQVLQSPAIAAAVTDRLKLAETAGYGFEEGEAPDARSRDRAIRSVLSGLTVQRDGTSYAITISYAAADPQMAAKVVNAVIDSYTSGQKTDEYAQRAQEVMLLRDRLGVLRADVIRADQALASQRAASNLMNVGTDTAATQDTMQALNQQLAQARAEESAASARVAGAASTTDAAVNNLRSQQAQLEARRAELLKRYDASYPTVVAVTEQLNVITTALNGEVSRARAGALAEAQAARNRASSLQASVGQEKGALMAANRNSVQMGEVERNAAAAKSIYQALLDEYKQKIVALGTERSKAYVIGHAAPPNAATSPDPKAYGIGGILAALLMGAMVALGLETLEHGILSQAMAEEQLGHPVLASVPDIGTVRDAPLKQGTPGGIANHLLEHPHGVFAEAFRAISTALKLGTDQQLARTLAITSAVTDEGKTTTALCLARTAAATGIRVVLIDCDLRHRSATEAFAADSSVGLSEVLEGTANLQEAMVIDSASGAHFLPAGGMPSSKSELITSRAMRTLIARLRGSYDLVILETAPVLPIAESRALSAMADGTLMVVRWRKTPVDVARKGISLIDRAGGKLLGLVLARVSLHSSIASSSGEYVYYYPARPKAA